MGRKRPAHSNVKYPPEEELKRNKSARILKHVQKVNDGDVSVSELHFYCISTNGLVSKELRQNIWPKLLGIKQFEIPDHRAINRNLEAANSVNQVKLDVDRSFWRFPKGITDQKRYKLRNRITHIINAVFAQDHDLYYYQGYHEICAMLMLNCGDTIGFGMASVLSCCHFKDNHEATLKTSIAYCELIYGIVAEVDPSLMTHIVSSDAQCHFAISWVITWFAHDVDDFDSIARIYDACLASHPLFCVYLSAALMVQSRATLLAVSVDEMSDMHKALSLIPSTADFEDAISHAHKLITEVYPVQQALKSTNLEPSTRHLLQNSIALDRFSEFPKCVEDDHQFKYSPFFMGNATRDVKKNSRSSLESSGYDGMVYAVAGSTISIAVALGFMFLENLQTTIF